MVIGTLQSGLTTDRAIINAHLSQLFPEQASHPNCVVQEAMRCAVIGSAQRIRPILALRVARVLDVRIDLTLRAATAVELLHCASLVIDDLPCMDDSALRREEPSLHMKFGESTAVLAAFGLVALAARTLVECECAAAYKDRFVQFQIALLRSLDSAGLIAGQALDLRLNQHPRTISADDVSELKTVPLFMLAVAAGSLFADLNPNQKALLNGFGREFGLAFQMTDDLLDEESVDLALLEDKLTTLRATIAPFGPASRDLEDLVDYLQARVAPRHHQ